MSKHLQRAQETQAYEKKIDLLEYKLAARDRDLEQQRNMVEMLRQSEPGDGVEGALKTKMIDLTKKTRAQQVQIESHKTKNKQLELLVEKLSNEKVDAKGGKGKKKVIDATEAPAAPELGNEDFRRKYLSASNRLQELRQECQQIKGTLQKHRKVHTIFLFVYESIFILLDHAGC